MRDALIVLVGPHLGDPQAIMAIEETGFPKRTLPLGDAVNAPASPRGRVGGTKLELATETISSASGSKSNGPQ